MSSTTTLDLPTRQQTSQQSPLLLLPRELRDQIYKHVFSSSAIQIRPITHIESQKISAHYATSPYKHYTHNDPCNLLDPQASIAPRVSTALDTTIVAFNAQIHEEALQVLYESKTVYLTLYHGCKENSLLDSPQLPQILSRARRLKISTYNINFLTPHLASLSTRSDIKHLEIGFRTVHALLAGVEAGQWSRTGFCLCGEFW